MLATLLPIGENCPVAVSLELNRTSVVKVSVQFETNNRPSDSVCSGFRYSLEGK